VKKTSSGGGEKLAEESGKGQPRDLKVKVAKGLRSGVHRDRSLKKDSGLVKKKRTLSLRKSEGKSGPRHRKR